MEDKLIEVLSEFEFPVLLQGSLLPDEPYPDDFFTFWNNSSDLDSFYDDNSTEIIYDYDINFYSNNPENVYKYIELAIQKLKKAGFEISDEITHTGRGFTIEFIKQQRSV